MSEMPFRNPNKDYDGWESLDDDDSQEIKPAATNLQQQNVEKSPGAEEPAEVDEDNQHYEVVIESPGVKEVPQKVVYDVDDDTDDEATENYNNEARNSRI